MRWTAALETVSDWPQTLDANNPYTASFAPIYVEERDFRSLPKVSDDVFAIYRKKFDNYHKPLGAKVTRVPSAGTVVVERVELEDIDSESGDSAGVRLLRFSSTSSMPVIFFPGSNAIHMTNTPVMLKNTAAKHGLPFCQRVRFGSPRLHQHLREGR